MTAIPRLKTAMTPFPHAIDLDATLQEARSLMAEHEVRHLPVTEHHVPVGLVTDRDLKAVSASGGRDPESLRVRDVALSEVYVVDLNEPLDNVLLTMAERHIGSTLVTRAGRLAGVFTCVDACRAFGVYLRERFPHGGGNEAA